MLKPFIFSKEESNTKQDNNENQGENDLDCETEENYASNSKNNKSK